MTTSPATRRRSRADVQYPTNDGRPMGETDLHRDLMATAIETLKLFYAGQRVYVSGNILLFYRPGNRRRHVSPDVLVTKGLEQRRRDNYLLWQVGRPPNIVIEITSRSTREEDLEDKFEIYRDEVRVAEYFLFDPRGEYLRPALQGYRLQAGQYERIKRVSGRLPSVELGLHLEQHENQLRFWDPTTRRWLPTEQEAREAAEADRQQAQADRQQAEAECRRAEVRWQQAQAEAERLRQELESLRRKRNHS
jgi:Uma2 family endonuclease